MQNESVQILIVEDEPDIQEVVAFALEREGFQTDAVDNGVTAWETIEQAPPDLVILDLMLPGIDGLELCRRLRASDVGATLPIIMVTARDEEADIILGLELGADDYVTKPFSPREVAARTKAVLRRREREQEHEDDTDRIAIDSVVIDLDRHRVTVDGQEAVFTATEFGILRALAESPGRVYSRSQILRRATGDDIYVTARSVDVHVRAIRRKLGRRRDLIETVRGIGYRFKEPS